MTAALAEISPLMTAALWQFFVVFLRVGAFVSLMPAFGERSVPPRIKLVVALAFTLIVFPTVNIWQVDSSLLSIIRLSLSETLSGLMLGLGIRMFVLALQTAGSIAGQSTSLAQILGSAAADPVPAMGYILVIGAIALAVMTGLHIKAAQLVIISYEFLPIGTFPNGSVLSKWGLDQIRRCFALAFTLAAPFVLISVLYNLALGVINKAMPQLMVAFVGAPVITAAGLLILCMAAPLILATWLTMVDDFIANPFQALP